MENRFKNNPQTRQQINKPQSTENKKESSKSKLDEFGSFLYDAFISTPYQRMETIIEILLLLVGSFRTVDFLQTMGQTALMAVFGLVYSEALILGWEYMGYKGKSVKLDSQFFWEKTSKKRYPFFNQKTVARFGLIMHMILTAVFTTSDLVLKNLKTISGGQYNVDTMFGWVLGIGIGIAFAFDLIFLLIYKNTNPSFQHQLKMEQLDYEIEAAELELKRIERQAEIDYKKKNAVPLAETRARLSMQKSLKTEFGEALGEEYVNEKLDGVDLSTRNTPQRPQSPQRPISDNGGNIRPTPPREQLQRKNEETEEETTSTLTAPTPEHSATNFTIPLQKK